MRCGPGRDSLFWGLSAREPVFAMEVLALTRGLNFPLYQLVCRIVKLVYVKHTQLRFVFFASPKLALNFLSSLIKSEFQVGIPQISSSLHRHLARIKSLYLKHILFYPFTSGASLSSAWWKWIGQDSPCFTFLANAIQW